MAIEAGGLPPLAANVAAFGVAVVVSFFGHFCWTFRSEPAGAAAALHRRMRAAFARFAVVALLGLALNSAAVVLTVDLLALPYPFAILLMVSVVPLAVFALSRFWAFA